MRNANTRKLVLLLALVVIGLLGMSEVFGQGVPRGSPEARAVELKNLLSSIEGADKEPARVFRTGDGYIRFLGAAPSTRFAAADGTPEEQADAFLEKWRNLFVNESVSVELERKRIKARNGRSYVRYRQRYGGLEVFGGSWKPK